MTVADLKEEPFDHAGAAARRYHEVVQHSGGHRRYIGALIMPVIAALTVPGPWWIIAFACVTAAAAWEHFANRWTQRRLATIENGASKELRAFTTRMLTQGAVAISLYALPNFMLAFAPAPGPAIGYAFALLGLVVWITQASAARAMMALTTPVLGLTMLANALAIPWPWGPILALVGLCVNTIASSRSAAHAISELIDRQLQSESAALVLEQRVKERTADLRASAAEADKANRAKSLFLANMSHELRTPLNAIIGYTEIVREDLAAGGGKNIDEDLARVNGAARHLLKLIEDVLDISKVEAQRVSLNDEHLDVRVLAGEALDTVAPIAAGNRTTCELIVSPGAETMQADRTRIKQCLINLLSNAAKFTHDGRVILHIRLTEHAGAPAIAFEVTDTGIGIDKDVQARLFEPFVQADDSITRAYGGTGLGLSITRRLVNLMGGDVALASDLGKGSRFTLTVPRVRVNQQATDQAISAAAA